MSYSPKHFRLPPGGVLPKDAARGVSPYLFDDTMAIAIDVALATDRPLLVSGNPGCGKSRLADAIAEVQGWSLLARTISSRTRLETLTAEVDQLRRLHDAQAGDRATLFPERTARHLLVAALATRRPGGTLDLPRLIAALCRREPLRALPRRGEDTVAQGCQLLLDYSGPMVPFWEDLNDLADQVRDVLGEPAPWRPDGRPVLVATDLGIQGRTPAAPDPDWPGFAACCAQAGSPLILLIPWPADRWPGTFPPGATLVHWGPRTTAGMVRRQARARSARP